MSSPLIVAWGELLWDLLPDGQRLGGAPANVAFHVTALGSRACLVSRVGRDALGAAAIAELTARGVPTDQVQRGVLRPTGTVAVDLSSGEPCYEIAVDVAWDRIEATDALCRFLAESAVFYFGTLAQRTIGARRQLGKALDALPDGCVRLCDLNLRPPHDTREVIDLAIEAATVIKLSEQEVAVIADLFGVRDVPHWLAFERGIELVALTLGPGGSLIYTGDECFAHDPVPVSGSGDPIGAGDAYTAVLAHHLAHGTPAHQIGELANLYASHVAARHGAMPEVPPSIIGTVSRTSQS